jgi:hypothetical protein
MQTLLLTARNHWKHFIWAWSFPFFMVFVYIPLEKALPEYRWWLWIFLSMPVFFASFAVAYKPVLLKYAPALEGTILVVIPPLPLMLIAIGLRDVIIYILS